VIATAGRRWRVAVTVAVLATLLWPALRNHDSFPLSTYPMYAASRPAVVTFATAVGVDAAGDEQRLSLRTIARTDDPLVAQAAVRQAVDQGRADVLCREIAGRTALGVVAVEVVEERHDVVARTLGEQSLQDRTVHARCEVSS
jgi:hypothetical protein